MALPVLTDLQFNAEDVAEAVAAYLQGQNTTLGTIITNLANDYAQLQSDIETNLKADNTFIAAIAAAVGGATGMKFKSIGKPASGSPPENSTWIAYAVETTSWWGGSTYGFGFGFGQPCAVGQYNANGSADWSYLDIRAQFDSKELLSSVSTGTSGTIDASNIDSRRAIGYTYTLEIENVT